MKKTIIICLAFIASMHFVNAQTKAEKKEAKEEKAQNEYEATQALINSNAYVFEATWARTQKGRRINLVGNPNYLKINNNTSKAQLPYFGVVQSVPYGGDGGISFESELSEYKVEKNDKKKKIIITYKAGNTSEQYSLTLTVYHSGSASLFINSISKNGITYDGMVTSAKEFKEVKE